MAYFISGEHKEKTACHPNATHLIRHTGESTLCNFTYQNSGMPWYCVRPKGIHLLCEDWHGLGLFVPRTFPLTSVEKGLFRYVTNVLYILCI